ncbi:hypothetical protein B0H17DRAFT_1208518 [Mycena rosella]|uniref:Uncharacterized protein n=1 Tax=Mycena rosella TaxID=1033263 RepID=A0AAD7D0Z7_MYCRO|nr:hypothetical protein B0H17DRAFT_1208518 [Mycena rosella]
MGVPSTSPTHVARSIATLHTTQRPLHRARHSILDGLHPLELVELHGFLVELARHHQLELQQHCDHLRLFDPARPARQLRRATTLLAAPRPHAPAQQLPPRAPQLHKQRRADRSDSVVLRAAPYMRGVCVRGPSPLPLSALAPRTRPPLSGRVSPAAGLPPQTKRRCFALPPRLHAAGAPRSPAPTRSAFSSPNPPLFTSQPNATCSFQSPADLP